MSETRRRATKACDQCRRLKAKCIPLDMDLGCTKCYESDTVCTFCPTKKRGPQKGYLSLIERKMHELSALVGVMLSIPDPHLQEVFRLLNRDHLGNCILSGVSDGAFGPLALQRYATRHSASMNANATESPPAAPTNEWQAYILNRYIGLDTLRSELYVAERALHPINTDITLEMPISTHPTSSTGSLSSVSQPSPLSSHFSELSQECVDSLLNLWTTTTSTTDPSSSGV